ncbi:MAG: hypothetical protein KBA97_10590 [Methanothrix sp.]|nr:hypothetical protein [Methanothrix sp.]
MKCCNAQSMPGVRPPSGLPGSSYLIDASALEDSRTLNPTSSPGPMCREKALLHPARNGSPPACFSLDCSTMGAEENWIPCAPANRRIKRAPAAALARMRTS